MHHKKKIIKRIYYPAGLISLIFLPLLCIWFINKNEPFKQYRIISATFVTNNKSLDFAFVPAEITSKRDFTYFTLTGNEKEDQLKVKQARIKIRELVRSQDTTLGVCFRFNDLAKFWTFVKAIEICRTENAKLFVPYENDIWIYNLAPKKQKVADEWVFGCNIIPATNCTAGLTSYLQEQKDLKRQENINETKGLIKEYSVSILLFLGMVFLTVKKANKKKHKHSIKRL